MAPENFLEHKTKSFFLMRAQYFCKKFDQTLISAVNPQRVKLEDNPKRLQELVPLRESYQSAPHALTFG